MFRGFLVPLGRCFWRSFGGGVWLEAGGLRKCDSASFLGLGVGFPTCQSVILAGGGRGVENLTKICILQKLCIFAMITLSALNHQTSHNEQ